MLLTISFLGSFLAGTLPALHQARELLVARGMAVLGLWALLNLGLGAWLAFRTFRAEGQREAFYFHLMNAGWGLVNAALAGAALLVPKPGLPPTPTLAALLTEQLRLENLLLLNTGLDVAYVMTGCWLRARAGLPGARQPARLAGFGRSLWVQGGFLFLFDVGLWLAVHQFAAPLLSKVP